ncbi:peptide chain release factor N(5)-glutamine methyltransferase [Bifidobacterium magnum]|uniref:Release factor glutamine methyltransferase n=1 Tax=Bifidobacterium magnum TaxID=1692 RepID=A0A087BBQ2_9BIFI|nr:Peptide release factor-glutamine N5-methyltransferase [Bifidobacterium magnum]
MTQTTQAFGQTLDSIIREATGRLRDAGVDTPHYDAKLLLAQAFHCSVADVDKAMLMRSTPAQLVWSVWHDQNGEQGVAPEEGSAQRALEEFESYVARRAGREPLQHITGHAPFRYIDVAVGPGVFVPRPETETVVQAAIDWIAEQGLPSPRVVDLCAGSGVIGLSMCKEVPGAQVWAVELNPEAAHWALRNRDALQPSIAGLDSNYQLEIGDATSPLTLAQLDGTVDVVISNPPYIPQTDIPEQPETRDYDPDLALYGGSADGMMIPEQIMVRAAALLRSGGLLVMEHDISQAQRTRMFAQANGFATAVTREDLTGRPRFLVAIKQ